MAIWLAEEVMLGPQLLKDDREGMGEGKTMNSAWDVQTEGHRVWEPEDYSQQPSPAFY